MSVLQRQEVVCAWAAGWMKREDVVILDVETTGLTPLDEVIELAVVTAGGQTLLSTLIQPENSHREHIATPLHGITKTMLATAPRFLDVWPTLSTLLQERPHVLAYNAAFDHRLLAQTTQRYGVQLPEVEWGCVMEHYANHHGAWNSFRRSYTWQSLDVACTALGVQRASIAHRALADALDTVAVMRALAERCGTQSVPHDTPLQLQPLDT